MTLLGLCDILDAELLKEQLILHEDETKYAVPARSFYEEYDEIFREYKMQDGRIFTVIVRKSKPGSMYWVRCGYKNHPNSKYVGIFGKRDISTHAIGEIIQHCRNCLEYILNVTRPIAGVNLNEEAVKI